MLETLRRNSRSAIIYVLFGILIAVFALSFGPQSRGLTVSTTSSSVVAKIDGASLTEQDFRFVYVASRASSQPPQVARENRLRERTMDKLIEREILAEEGKKLGFLVSQKEAEDLIADGKFLYAGYPSRVDPYAFPGGKFDYDKFKNVAQNSFGVSVLRFLEIQQRELLAEKMRESLRGGIRVAPAEVKAEFVERNLQVNLEFVKFSARKFETDEEPSAADVAAYAKAHETELKKIYEDRKALLFTKTDKQARLRHILVEVNKDAAPDTVAKAKARIDDAKKQLDAGGAFSTVSTAMSTYEPARRRHGAIGWKKKGFAGFGEALDAKVFTATMKKGDLIGPERGDHGFELVLIEDVREGDISYEQAVPELAEQEMARDRAKEKAKAEAQAVIDKTKAGEKLEALFPPPKDDAKDEDDSPAGKMARLMGSQSDAPALKETGSFQRHGETIPQIGISKTLAQKAFSLAVGEIAGPFEAGNAYVVVRVKEHKDPDLKDFEKRHAELERESARVKWYTTVAAWTQARCTELRDAGQIKVSDEVMTYEGGSAARGIALKVGKDGKELKDTYVPCSPRGAF